MIFLVGERSLGDFVVIEVAVTARVADVQPGNMIAESNSTFESYCNIGDDEEPEECNPDYPEDCEDEYGDETGVVSETGELNKNVLDLFWLIFFFNC